MGRGARRGRRLSVAGQLLVLQSLLLFLVLASAGTISVLQAGARQNDLTAAEVQRVALQVALDPVVRAGVTAADPTAQLQPYAERIRMLTGTDFVVIMAPDRTRFTHPDPTQIGRPFVGTIAPALEGRAFTETFTGTLGPSVRAVSPVRNLPGPGLSGGTGGSDGTDGAADPTGPVVALVAVGVTTASIRQQFVAQLPFLVTTFVVLILIALAGAGLVSRRLNRQTGGLDPQSLRHLYSSQNAVLHSIREGVIVLDQNRRVALVNDEAQRLLGLAGDATGAPVRDLPLPGSLNALLSSGLDAHDEQHLASDRILVVNQSRAEFGGRSYGSVATLRDRTEMAALTGELDTVRAFAESLRSQAHEASNKLHTMVMLVETGCYAKAVEYATAELELSQRLTDRVVAAVDEPVLAALLLGKTAQAAERGVELRITEDSHTPPVNLPIADLITLLGNLIDNAIDATTEAAVDGRRSVDVAILPEGGDLVVEVSDSGPGLPPEVQGSAFNRGWSTKPVTTLGGRGLGLALVDQVVKRHRGSIEVDTGPYGGAHFTVRIPLRAVPTDDERDLVDEAPMSEQPR